MTLACSPERNMARDYCKQYEECEPTEFSRTYDSVTECTKVNKKWAKAQHYALKKLGSPECAKASRKYDQCVSDARTCAYFADDDAAWQQWSDRRDVVCGTEEAEYELQCDDYYYY